MSHNNTQQHTITHAIHTQSIGNFFGPFFAFVGITAGYAFVAGALVSYVEPLAAGSGIPEIKTYLNGVHIKVGVCAWCLQTWCLQMCMIMCML